MAKKKSPSVEQFNVKDLKDYLEQCTASGKQPTLQGFWEWWCGLIQDTEVNR